MPSQPKAREQDFETVRCLDVSLAAQLETYTKLHQTRRQTVADMYDELVSRLKSGDAGQTALAKGDKIDGFFLPDTQGRLVSLDEMLNRGPLVISFNRGSWCPFCRLELLALAKIHSDIVSLGGNIVSIIPEREAPITLLKDDYDLPFRVLSDIDNAYALTNGLMISIGVELQQVLLQNGVDLADLHGNNGLFLPITATYIIAPDGIVAGAFVDPDFRQRMQPEHVIAALTDLQ